MLAHGFSRISFQGLLMSFAFTALPVPSSAVPLDHQAIPSDLLITLERTSCFGPCLVYKVTVARNGTV
jgi:hypothetical protein